jgi:alkylation response protein AidB-like acyl-CoA dehydrogenase
VRFARSFQTALHSAGPAGISWPTEYGGQGLSDAAEREFVEISKEFALPNGMFSIGLGMCGPTILAHGSEEQKQRYIRPLLRGDDVWSQLFSEPGAGSDLASLRTSAVRDGDVWRVRGHKMWTSHAQHARFGLLLARTDLTVPKHLGLTMFILDMAAQGVLVSPIRDMTGQSRFNEVFLEDVIVDDSARIGEIGAGWKVAIATLTAERMSVAGRVRAQSHALSFSSLVSTAREAGAIDQPGVRDSLVELYVRERLAELLGARFSAETRAGRPPGARGSVGKLVSAELSRYSAAVGMAVLGARASNWSPDDHPQEDFAAILCEAPMMGIAGGTNEIQRNILGERVLGLPREPTVTTDAPVLRRLTSTTAEPVT